MEFFANKFNGKFLRNVLPGETVDVDFVRAAIAYGSDASTLIENCLRNRRRLDIWMRYDHTVPVAPHLLRKLLAGASSNIFCSLVPDVLHSKVIWWKGYGAYVGSANLTDRAWVTNIEFGVFLSEPELDESGGLEEISLFFEQLEHCDAALPLTLEIVEEQEQLQKLRQDRLHAIDSESKRRRSIETWGGPAEVASRKKAIDAGRAKFIKEWADGLTFLRALAEKAPEYRPKWMNEDVPAAWQADQFLHAYYYNEVVDGVRHPFEEFYLKNRSDPKGASDRALRWWSGLAEPPSHEDENCHVRAPIIREVLAKRRIKELILEDFVRVCQANHSTMDHVRRMRLDTLGVKEEADELARGAAFATWLWGKRNQQGESVVDLLQFVLDDGGSSDLPRRIFEATRSEERRFPHFGINQVAEIAGWARPELSPPRNGRTSKGLRALGFDVRIY